MEEKKRGRPRKETALALVEPEAPVEAPEPVKLKRTRKKPEAEPVEVPVEVPEPVKLKRTRKKPDPETAISSDVSFNSARGAVSFKALRAPPKQKADVKMEEKIEEQGYQRPYAYLHDRYSPYGHFMIA